MPEGDWFCCHDCSTIHSTFQNLLVRGAEKLPEPLLDVIKKKQEEKGLESLSGVDVKWRLLKGKIVSPETKPFLLQAISIFHVCSVIFQYNFMFLFTLLWGQHRNSCMAPIIDLL